MKKNRIRSAASGRRKRGDVSLPGAGVSTPAAGFTVSWKLTQPTGRCRPKACQVAAAQHHRTGDPAGAGNHERFSQLREDTARLTANVLLWEDNGVITRLESRLSKDEMLAIAASARCLEQ